MLAYHIDDYLYALGIAEKLKGTENPEYPQSSEKAEELKQPESRGYSAERGQNRH